MSARFEHDAFKTASCKPGVSPFESAREPTKQNAGKQVGARTRLSFRPPSRGSARNEEAVHVQSEVEKIQYERGGLSRELSKTGAPEKVNRARAAFSRNGAAPGQGRAKSHRGIFKLVSRSRGSLERNRKAGTFGSNVHIPSALFTLWVLPEPLGTTPSIKRSRGWGDRVAPWPENGRPGE